MSFGIFIFFLATGYLAQFGANPEYDHSLPVDHEAVAGAVMAVGEGAAAVAMVAFVWPYFTPLGQRKHRLEVP